jgi:DNA-binding Lrp family transcriptional regulator
VLLKQLFTTERAGIVMLLTYKSEPLDRIQERAKNIGKSAEEIGRLLKETAARGVIGLRKKDGVNYYRTIPQLVGMPEGAVITAPPEKKPPLVAAAGHFTCYYVCTRVQCLRMTSNRSSINSSDTFRAFPHLTTASLKSPPTGRQDG